MEENRLRKIERLGLDKADFEPKEVDTEQRLDAIESALLDIIMGGGFND